MLPNSKQECEAWLKEHLESSGRAFNEVLARNLKMADELNLFYRFIDRMTYDPATREWFISDQTIDFHSLRKALGGRNALIKASAPNAGGGGGGGI